MESPINSIRKTLGFGKIIAIKTADPALKRRGQLMAVYLVLCFVLLIYTTLNNIIIQIVAPSAENLIYLYQDLFVFIPFVIFWQINRNGWVQLTAYISFGFTILATVLFTEPKYTEYLMVVLALPIGMSSFVLRPSSSFYFATLTAVFYTISSIVSGYVWEYNLTAITALYAMAFMTWVASGQLENALKKNENLVRSLQESNREIQEAYETTIEGWSRALEIRDRETEGHSVRVTELTLRMANRMGFSHDQVTHIRRGALLHDIGKLGIPDEILRKTGRLTTGEMNVMQLHPQIAVDLLSPIDYLKPAMLIPRYHHEKWDGSGYPHKLKGDEIPLEARIFAIIDVFDALSHDRPYRKAWEREKVLEYIKAESGKHFDPAIVEIFIDEIRKGSSFLNP